MSQTIYVPGKHFLVEITRPNWRKLQENGVMVKLISVENPPVYAGTHFLVNIGEDRLNPILLDLKFAPIGGKKNISLLMTDQRTPKVLDEIAKQIVRKLGSIEFDAVVAPQSLGPLLSTAVARTINPNMPCASIMKGKPLLIDGKFEIGPPKPWIDPTKFVEFMSGTSLKGSIQRFYADDTFIKSWARERQALKVCLIDDARLTGGTTESCLELLAKHHIDVAAIVTVLNEHQHSEQINGVPYFYLTKLPLFKKDHNGYIPIKGTYDGLEQFYVEV